MFDDDKGLYTIGTVAELLEEHPETLRVWERNGLIHPDRENSRRKYSNNDLKRLKFIKYFMDEKGLNIAGVKQLIAIYSCWFRKNCQGGAHKNSSMPVNEAKPCWRIQETYCLVPSDKSDWCNSCEMFQNCQSYKGCKK